jgi:uncharacterized protein
MNIWAIADLHLSISTPSKSMELISDKWKNYELKIKENWSKLVKESDLVLIPGDISWAASLFDVQKDLNWIDNLPGKKLLLKGNHDFWWGSLKKIKAILPKSISVLQNDIFIFNGTAIGGARLWDTQEYSFSDYIDFKINPFENKDLEKTIQDDLKEKIFARELSRLEISLSKMPKNAKNKIAITHYPPISADLKNSKASEILEKYNIEICIFGHLHSLKKNAQLFGNKNNIRYLLTSADYIEFTPIKII